MAETEEGMIGRLSPRLNGHRYTTKLRRAARWVELGL
jgi:hypothetical protein